MQIAQDVMCPSKRTASVPLAPPPRLLLPASPTYVLADGTCGAPLHGAQECRPGGGGACMVMEKLYGNGALKYIMCEEGGVHCQDDEPADRPLPFPPLPAWRRAADESAILRVCAVWKIMQNLLLSQMLSSVRVCGG